MDNKRNTTTAKSSSFLAVGGVLILVAVLADVADWVCFQSFLQRNGVGLFQTVPWGLTWQYVTTFPGHVLTFLGTAPYVVVIAVMTFKERSRRTAVGCHWRLVRQWKIPINASRARVGKLPVAPGRTLKVKRSVPKLSSLDRVIRRFR